MKKKVRRDRSHLTPSQYFVKKESFIRETERLRNKGVIDDIIEACFDDNIHEARKLMKDEIGKRMRNKHAKKDLEKAGKQIQETIFGE